MQSETLSRRRKTNWKAIIIAGLILLAILGWTQGTFDNLLWHVGLNYNDCGTNGFGATFCGDDLTRYQQRFDQIK